MLSNRLAFLLLGVACVSAAAGGGYLATRQNSVPVPAAAQSAPAAAPAPVASVPPTTTAAPVATTPERPAVQETEAVVNDRAAKPAPRPVDPPPSRATASRDVRPASQSARREQAPALKNTWPSSAQQQPTPAPPPLVAPEPPAQAEERTVTEPVRAPEPPRPTFEELVVSRDSVIGLQTENRISTETARVEDRVDARVTRDVRVGNRIAIPSGSRVLGTVTQVERGGKYKEQAKLGIRFHTIVLGSGERLPISTETILRVGEAPDSAKKIGGGAVGGAILGAILGGAKGAAIGATAGAGAGTAVVQAGDRNAVILAPGTPLTARILSPVTVTIERE